MGARLYSGGAFTMGSKNRVAACISRRRAKVGDKRIFTLIGEVGDIS